MNNNNYSFYLGGHDLEMLEIKRMLQDQGYIEGVNLFDRNLEWHNAHLSVYRTDIQEKRINIGIELKEDIEPPPHYISIDHHNERADELSSIEQVSELLTIPLNRKQLLIAANDKGHIPAMQAMGASEEEIAAIRLQDRSAQGVTQEHEEEAKRAIASQVFVDGVAVIKTQSDKFSPIADRMYQKNHLLIYSDKELTYYGNARDLLANAFSDLISAQKAYYGGSSNGFFGIGKGHFSPLEIEKLKTEIINHIASQNALS
ncbi:MAG: hypothetical protein AAF927_03525 [Bacteroidota bacterium]